MVVFGNDNLLSCVGFWNQGIDSNWPRTQKMWHDLALFLSVLCIATESQNTESWETDRILKRCPVSK